MINRITVTLLNPATADLLTIDLDLAEGVFKELMPAVTFAVDKAARGIIEQFFGSYCVLEPQAVKNYGETIARLSGVLRVINVELPAVNGGSAYVATITDEDGTSRDLCLESGDEQCAELTVRMAMVAEMVLYPTVDEFAVLAALASKPTVSISPRLM